MAAMMLLCCVACGGGTQPPIPTDTTASITIGTGSTSGTYYAYTNAVGMILKDATGYTYNVISTGGSVANINGIEDGDYNMAIVQNDTMIKAYNKLDDFTFPVAITSFSVLGEVYSEVMQVVVRSDLKDTVKTLTDVKGLRVSIGDAGSGTEANAKALLAAYGVSTDDITVQNLSVNNSADAMKDGKLDVFFFTSGAPTTAITELQTAMDIYLLGLDDAVMDEFIANNKGRRLCRLRQDGRHPRSVCVHPRRCPHHHYRCYRHLHRFQFPLRGSGLQYDQGPVGEQG